MTVHPAALAVLLAVASPLTALAQGADPLAERLRNPTFGGSYFGGSLGYGSLDADSLTETLLGAVEAETDLPLLIDRSGVDTFRWRPRLRPPCRPRDAGAAAGCSAPRPPCSACPGEPGGAAVIDSPLTGERAEIATTTELDYGTRVVAKGGVVTGGILIYGLLGPAYARGEAEAIVTERGDVVSRTAGDFDGFGLCGGPRSGAARRSQLLGRRPGRLPPLRGPGRGARSISITPRSSSSSSPGSERRGSRVPSPSVLHGIVAPVHQAVAPLGVLHVVVGPLRQVAVAVAHHLLHPVVVVLVELVHGLAA